MYVHNYQATETHIGILKAKLSKLRRELLEVGSAGRKGGVGGAGERGFEVSKVGDTRVGYVNTCIYTHNIVCLLMTVSI